MNSMDLNEWIKKSMKLAQSEGYLDGLTEIYPLISAPEREIPREIEEEIKKSIKKKDKINLMKTLFKLKKFPIENPYIGCLREDEKLIDKNPKVVDMIAEYLFSMGAEGIIKASKQPKKISRQYGPAFQRWLRSLGYKVLKPFEFETSRGIIFLGGSDKICGNYANKKLKCGPIEKGLDLLAKVNDKFIIGNAKFITVSGGAQDNQFSEAMRFVTEDRGNAIRIAILDGVVWFNGRYLRKIREANRNILSALLLKEFLESFR